MRPFRGTLLLSLAFAGAAPLGAQSPEIAAALRAFRDTVQAENSVDNLRRRLTEEEGREGSFAIKRIRQGLVLVALGKAARDPQLLHLAVERFCHAVNDQPRWWFPNYGVGSAALALGQGKYPIRPAPCQEVGTTWFQGAGLAFAEALRLNPASPEAAEGMADAVEANPLWGLGEVATTALERYAAAAPKGNPRPLLLAARTQREKGDRPRVMSLLQDYLAAGGDSGIGLLEMARESFERGDRDQGVAQYWNGVSHSSTSGALDVIRTQLALVARPGELEGFDSLQGPALTSFVRRFWNKRDVEASAPPGTRLAEHYRRLEIAMRGMRPVVLGMGGNATSLAERQAQGLLNAPTSTSSGTPPATTPADGVAGDQLFGSSTLALQDESAANAFDIRGQVFIRHGEPDDMAANLWVYRENGREFIVRVNSPSPGTPCSVSPKFCYYEVPGRRAPPEQLKKWEAEARQDVSDLKRTDGARPYFKSTFTPGVRLYALPKTKAGDGRVLLAFAVPVKQLEALPLANGVAYQVRVRVTLGDSQGDTRTDRDTLRTFVAAAPLQDDAYLQAFETISLAPGSYLARVTLTSRDSAVGSMVQADSIQLRDGTNALALSDLIFGKEGAGLVWNSPDGVVRLNPLGNFRRKELLETYYIVAGLPAGTKYKTTLQIFKGAIRNQKPEVSLSFEDESSGASAQVRRTISLDRLSPGNYMMRVTVSTPGSTATREAPITVMQ